MRREAKFFAFIALSAATVWIIYSSQTRSCLKYILLGKTRTVKGKNMTDTQSDTHALTDIRGVCPVVPAFQVARRTDVITETTWFAPVVWEGTFDTVLLDAIYKPLNISVATTVFAVGKYVGFLKDFLETAEKHFLVGYRVHYYIFTDQPEAVPKVTLGVERYLTPLKIPSSDRWQDISMRRMETIENLIEISLAGKFDYIFSLDVDTKFYGHWGAETFGDLVAAIHFAFYKSPREDFTYERRPESQAYIPKDEGDFYYGGAMIGGRVEEVYKLVKTCHYNIDIDRANSIEAVWQEESHLNKYLLYNKPTKVLSPEYLWWDLSQRGPEMKIIRYSHVKKKNSDVRPN